MQSGASLSWLAAYGTTMPASSRPGHFRPAPAGAILPCMVESSTHSRLATAGGFAAIVLWSTSFAVARSIAEQVGAFRAAAGIYSICAILVALSLISSADRRRKFRSLPPALTTIRGLLFVEYMVAIYMAVGLAADRTQTLVVVLLNYLWPPLTILLSLRLLGAKANWALWPGTALAVILTQVNAELIGWLGRAP